MLAELQRSMREALLEIDSPPPDGVPAGRFDIYRSSVVYSLEQALSDAFPATEALVGRTWFRPAARAFARISPPRRPQLCAYGAGFAEFLAANATDEQHPALLDLARFEWNRVSAFFAADAPLLSVERLLNIPAIQYPSVRFILHPSVRTWLLDRKDSEVCSVLSEVGRFAPSGRTGHAGVLVLRSGRTVTGTFLRLCEVKLLSALSIGATLSEASAFAQSSICSSDDELQAMLGRFIRLGLFSDFLVTAGAMPPRYGND